MKWPTGEEEGKIIDVKKYGKYLIISYKTKLGISFAKIKLEEKYDKDRS